MGQSILSVKEKLGQDYKYIKKYSNSCYGELTLLQSKTSLTRYALKEIITDNPNMQTLLKSKKLNHSPSLINVVDYWVKAETGFCTTISEVYLLLEYEEMTLQEQIIERHHNHKEFTILELRRILLSSVEVLMELQKSKSSFHIGVENTLITQNGEIKVVEPDLISCNLTDQEQKSRKKRHFCDEPELTEQSDKEMDAEATKAKASIFYLGVMMLSCCTLDEALEQQIVINNGYDFQKLKRIGKTVCCGDKKFSSLLTRMVKKNPFKRPSYWEIMSEMSPILREQRNIGNTEKAKVK